MTDAPRPGDLGHEITSDPVGPGSGSEFATAVPPVRVPTALTFGGLLAGLVTGLLLGANPRWSALVGGIEAVGGLWLRGLQMTIVPLVSSLMVMGVLQTVATARAGTMARRTLGLFLLILAAGTVLVALVFPPVLDRLPIPRAAIDALQGASAAPAQLPSFADFLNSLVPINVIDAAAHDAMLPTIVFFVLLAAAIARLPERPRRLLGELFAAVASAMLVVIGWVLRLAPVGVFALALGLAARSGGGAIVALAHYILLVGSIGAVVLVAGYALAVGGAGLAPARFFKAMLPVQAVAFSTQSSLASLPAMLGACRELGLRAATADFVLPLAVALFRATSPAMNLAVAIYVARLTGVALTGPVLITGVAVALLVSPSTVSLPGALSFISTIGPIALAMGVPVGPLGLLVAVEMLPDLMRTLGNVTMDVAVTATIDRNAATTRHD